MMDSVSIDATGPPRALDRHAETIPVAALGMALGLFFVTSFLICVMTYLIPGLRVSHTMLTVFLPGFELLTWQSFCLGLVESFVWGWFVALIFGPLYNFFTLRWP